MKYKIKSSSKTKTNQYRLTLVVPCFGRPARTRRMLNNILAQDTHGWEAFVIGDGCKYFNTLINSGEKDFYTSLAEKNGNKLHMFNMDKNYGGWGYHIVNYAIENSKGDFFIFAGNDDRLDKSHFSNYLNSIENTDLDMVYHKTMIEPYFSVRDPFLQKARVGHSELIIRTSVLKGIEQQPIYEADWGIIEEIMKKTNKIKKSDSNNITYFVTRIGNSSTDIID